MGYGITHFEVTSSNLVQTLSSEHAHYPDNYLAYTCGRRVSGTSLVPNSGSYFLSLHFTSATIISETLKETLPGKGKLEEMLSACTHTRTLMHMNTHAHVLAQMF